MLNNIFARIKSSVLNNLKAGEISARYCLKPRKRESSFPYLSEGTWHEFCDWKLNFNGTLSTENIGPGDTLFVEAKAMDDFAVKYLPEVRNDFILVTPRTDLLLPGKYLGLLDSPKISAWFVQNIDREPSGRVIPLPIGLASNLYRHGDPNLYNSLIPSAQSSHSRPVFVYVNFCVDTNEKERKPCLQFFLGKKYAKIATAKSPYAYLRDLSQSIFVPSPAGNGLDCHRTWEALLMGCYPIIKHSTLDPLFEGLPVVLIDNWNEVTETFLQKRLQELKSTTWQLEKLYAPYWFRKVREAQSVVRKQPLLAYSAV